MKKDNYGQQNFISLMIKAKTTITQTTEIHFNLYSGNHYVGNALTTERFYSKPQYTPHD